MLVSISTTSTSFPRSISCNAIAALLPSAHAVVAGRRSGGGAAAAGRFAVVAVHIGGVGATGNGLRHCGLEPVAAGFLGLGCRVARRLPGVLLRHHRHRPDFDHLRGGDVDLLEGHLEGAALRVLGPVVEREACDDEVCDADAPCVGYDVPAVSHGL